MTNELVRLEFEYPIPVADADCMLASLCDGPLVDKLRHPVRVAGHEWEIDEFLGPNAGLVVAEIELDAPDEAFVRPAWLGAEVTHVARFYNFNLATHPYTRWTDVERGAD
jgi:adenylate cyclase